MNIVQSIKRIFQRRQEPLDPALTFDENGFYRGVPNPFSVPWSSIVRITGYKIDLLTVDEIRMEVVLATGEIVIFTEKSPGFGALMAELETRFPSVVGWHAKVVHPAFAPCTTVLFGVPNQPLHPDASGGLTAAVVAGERRR